MYFLAHVSLCQIRVHVIDYANDYRGLNEILFFAAIRDKYKEKEIATSDRNFTAVNDADIVLIAVKPQVLEEV